MTSAMCPCQPRPRASSQLPTTILLKSSTFPLREWAMNPVSIAGKSVLLLPAKLLPLTRNWPPGLPSAARKLFQFPWLCHLPLVARIARLSRSLATRYLHPLVSVSFREATTNICWPSMSSAPGISPLSSLLLNRTAGWLFKEAVAAV